MGHGDPPSPSRLWGLQLWAAGRVAEPGSYLTPPRSRLPRKRRWSHQQTAHLPGKIPAEAETAVQGPPRAQDQVLYHVAQDLGARPRAQKGLATAALSACSQPPGTPTTSPARPRTLAGVISVLLLLSVHARCACVHACAPLSGPAFLCLCPRKSVSLCPQPSLSL